MRTLTRPPRGVSQPRASTSRPRHDARSIPWKYARSASRMRNDNTLLSFNHVVSPRLLTLCMVAEISLNPAVLAVISVAGTGAK